MTAREFPAPGEWQRIGPTTSVMTVPGGCVMREMIPRGDLMQLDANGNVVCLEPAAAALCFIPYRNEALGKAMERWIEQATERHKGEGK